MNDTKFKVYDEIKVNVGFFRGISGRVVDVRRNLHYDKIEYQVEVKGSTMSYGGGWYPEDNIGANEEKD